MRFPKQRIRFANSYDGKSAPGGFLVLDIKGLDIEGANALVLEMADVEAARSQGDRQEEAKRQARELLGGQ
jgi:hypothetical protein